VIVADTSVLFEAWERADRGDASVRERVEALVAFVLPVSAEAARLGASVIRWRARRRLPVPSQADGLIIGACLEHGAPVMTLDWRHFDGTPGLQLVAVSRPH